MKNFFRVLCLFTCIAVLPAAVFAAGSKDYCAMIFVEQSPDMQLPMLRVDFSRLDQYPRFNFRRYERILLLGDHGRGWWIPTQQRQILVPTGTKEEAGLLRPPYGVVMDNNRLPFKPGSFDFIGMNRGMCFCHDEHETCGGICDVEHDATKFLLSVAELLNPEKPHSIALLTGAAYSNQAQLQMWLKAAHTLQVLNPDFSVVMLTEPEGQNNIRLVGLAISPHPDVNIQYRIEQLLTSDAIFLQGVVF